MKSLFMSLTGQPYPTSFTPAALEMYKAMIAVALAKLRHW